MTSREMTPADLILAIAQTYPWGRAATLNNDETVILGCVHSFNSEQEAYSLRFTLPATIEAVMDYQGALQ